MHSLRLHLPTQLVHKHATSRDATLGSGYPLLTCCAAPPCSQVRTKTLFKNAIIQIDATPFKQWYAQHYGIELGTKKPIEEVTPKPEDVKVRTAARAATWAAAMCTGVAHTPSMPEARMQEASLSSEGSRGAAPWCQAVPCCHGAQGVLQLWCMDAEPVERSQQRQRQWQHGWQSQYRRQQRACLTQVLPCVLLPLHADHVPSREVCAHSSVQCCCWQPSQGILQCSRMHVWLDSDRAASTMPQRW
jgi:hypothetical protein